MKKVRVTTAIMVMALVSLNAMSCKDVKSESSSDEMHSQMSDGDHHDDATMDHDNMDGSHDMASSNSVVSDAKQIVGDYMMLKDALVASNKDQAAAAGKKMESSLNGFVMTQYTAAQQKELKDIISDAKEHATHIGKSELDHQREHFKTLSNDMMDMIAITGTDVTIYQDFCPMYDGGSAWLSMNKEIKNPYYGSKMMSCGKMQKEIK